MIQCQTKSTSKLSKFQLFKQIHRTSAWLGYHGQKVRMTFEGQFGIGKMDPKDWNKAQRGINWITQHWNRTLINIAISLERYIQKRSIILEVFSTRKRSHIPNHPEKNVTWSNSSSTKKILRPVSACQNQLFNFSVLAKPAETLAFGCWDCKRKR